MKGLIVISKKYLSGCICAALVSIFWGMSFIGSKEAMDGGLAMFTLVGVRFLITTACLVPIGLARKESFAIHGLKDVFLLAVTAVTGITLYYYCELQGLTYTSPSVSSLIIATIPVMSLMTGIVFRHRRATPLTWIGVLCSVAGVGLIVFTDVGENSLRGFLFLLGACINWIVYLEISDILLKRYSAFHVTFWQSVMSLISLIPLVCMEQTDLAAVTPRAWLWSIVFLGLVCSAACFMMNNYSIAVLKPQMNAVFLNLSPVATVICEYFMLGTVITPLQFVGGAIVLVSLFAITAAQGREKKRIE